MRLIQSKRIPPALAGLLLMLISHASLAGGQQLKAYLKDLKGLEAHFVQRLYDEDGELVEESEGEFYLQRPGKFRWDYHQPYAQQIVSDGDQVWIFDSELMQVVVRPVGEALGSSPASLLSSEQPLDTWFELVDENSTDGMQWITAIPRDQESAFVEVRMGFHSGQLEMIELQDNFGQTTSLQFTQSMQNPELDPAVFLFDIPPGTDIIRDQND